MHWIVTVVLSLLLYVSCPLCVGRLAVLVNVAYCVDLFSTMRKRRDLEPVFWEDRSTVHGSNRWKELMGLSGCSTHRSLGRSSFTVFFTGMDCYRFFPDIIYFVCVKCGSTSYFC